MHLAGERNNKLDMIGSETKCTIRVTHDSGDSQSPMIITITPKNRGDRTSDLLGAKLKIENSLLDFLGNDGSKARLLFELAASLRTSCNIMRSKGSAVHQRRYSHSVSNDKVWMRLLELPSCKTNGEEAQIKMLLSMTTQETDCSVETFFDQIDTPLKSCNPYVLIWGNHLGMVNSTTTLVYTALKGRQYHFQSETLEDDTQLKVLNAPSSSHENDWAL